MMKLDLDNVRQVFDQFPALQPDFFSLDIDGIDFYIMAQLLLNNFRPKIVCVEYNAAFGSESLVVKYHSDFDRRRSYPVFYGQRYFGMYCGASVSAWTYLFEQFNYSFVTVDGSGTNAFFILDSALDKKKLACFEGEIYKECSYNNKKWQLSAKEQFEIINHLPYYKPQSILDLLLRKS